MARLTSFLLTFCFLLILTSIGWAEHGNPNVLEIDYPSLSEEPVLPYIEVNKHLEKPDVPRRDDLTARFALIEERNPWGFDIEDLLEDFGEVDYDRYRAAQTFANLEFDDYDVIWIAPYQTDQWKTIYNNNRERIEEYVDNGGTLYHCTATNIWGVTPIHPGGLTHQPRVYESYGVTAVDPEDNIMFEMMEWEIGTRLRGTAFCHATYPEDDLQEIENSDEYEILIYGERTDDPIIARYTYGAGQVVVSGSTDGYLHRWRDRFVYGHSGDALITYLATLAGEREGYIDGHVVNLRDDEPIESASVSLSNGETTQTNEEGYFFFDEIETGEYTATAHKEGFNQVESEAFTVEAGDTTTVDFELPWGVLLEVTLTGPNGGEQYDAGQEVTITWDVENRHNVEMFVIEGSLDGGEHWGPIDTVDSDAREHITITPDAYSLEVMVRVTAYDIEGNQAWDQSDNVFTIAPTESQNLFHAGWTMMSVPLTPEDPSPEAVIDDDTDGVWALYGFSTERGNYNPDELTPGDGYWLAIGHDSVMVDVTGESLLDTARKELDLTWNMVGTPFPTFISVYDIFFRHEDMIYATEDAVTEGLILPLLYGHTPARGYFESNIMQPWHGYWFFTLVEGIEMLVPPPSPFEFEREEEPERDNNPGSGEAWELSVRTQFGEAIDEITTLGISPDASDEFDAEYDFPEPPPTPDEQFVKSYFVHDGWLRIISDQFNRDIRSMIDEDAKQWEMTVETDGAGDVTISWNEMQVRYFTQAYDFILEDPTTGDEINIREEYSYTFNTEGGTYNLIFHVSPSLSVDDDNPVADKYELLTAFPNPFNSSTIISYSVLYPGPVELSLYDLNGSLVKTLTAGHQTSGQHQITLNGKDLGNGIYFMKLETESVVQMRKIFLVK